MTKALWTHKEKQREQQPGAKEHLQQQERNVLVVSAAEASHATMSRKVVHRPATTPEHNLGKYC